MSTIGFIKRSKMNCLDMSQKQTGISSGFSSHNSSNFVYWIATQLPHLLHALHGPRLDRGSDSDAPLHAAPLEIRHNSPREGGIYPRQMRHFRHWRGDLCQVHIKHILVQCFSVIVTTDIVTNCLLWQIWLTIIDTGIEFPTVKSPDNATVG